MKIKYLVRSPAIVEVVDKDGKKEVLEGQEIAKLEKRLYSFGYHFGEEEEFSNSQEMSVETLDQLKSLMDSLTPEGNLLRDSTYDNPYSEFERPALPEDETLDLLNNRSFEEYYPNEMPCARWTVIFDSKTKPRKEQVSLTLSENILDILRFEANHSDQSLSKVIDARLRDSVISNRTLAKMKLERVLKKFEDLTKEAYGILDKSV